MSATAILGRLRRTKTIKGEPYARGHLYASPETGETWALFTLPGVEWVSRTGEARTSALAGAAGRWASLVGYRVWVRVMSEPFPAAQFASSLTESYPAASPSFGPLVQDMARCAERSGARVHRAILGVRVASTAVAREHLPLVLGERTIPTNMSALDVVRRDVERVTRAVAEPGMAGAPLTEAQTKVVCESSIRLGLPGAGQVFASADPYQATTGLTALHEGLTVTSHVQVLRVDEVADRDATTLMPWLAWPQTLPYQVDAVACGDIIDARDLVASAQLVARQNASIDSADVEQGFASRGEVAAGEARAVEVRDEMKNGDRIARHRFRGVIKYAVHAPTPEAAAAAGEALIADAAQDVHVTLSHNFGQYADYLTFGPGRAWDFTGHVTSQSLRCFAAAMPAVSQAAGDSTGLLLGAVGDSADLYLHDPFGRDRPNRPKVHALVGEPGCGKSTLMGLGIDYLAQAGVRVTANDPSGNLARLVGLPHLAGDARCVPITAGSHAGILMPHFLVPDPNRRDYATDGEYEVDMRRRAAERSNLAIDMTMACLPWSVVEHDRGTVAPLVEAAVAEVGSGFGVHSREIIDALARQGDRGKELAGYLKARANLGDGNLVYPAGDIDPDAMTALTASAALTVVTTPGLSVPPARMPRSAWSREHHESVPILLGASRFAALSIWADRQPKGHFDDELGLSGGSASFGSFLTRASLDSRKFGASIWFAFQTMTALDALPNDEIDSLLGPRFVGRTSGRTADAAAARLLGESSGAWRAMLPDLRDGEMVTYGWDRKVRCVQVDQAWWRPALRQALDTTASVPARRVDGLLGALR